MKPILTDQEVIHAFNKAWLEGKYDFLVEDLEKMAHEFVKMAAPKIAREERKHCIEFVNSLNTTVANALQEKRGKL